MNYCNDAVSTISCEPSFPDFWNLDCTGPSHSLSTKDKDAVVLLYGSTSLSAPAQPSSSCGHIQANEGLLRGESQYSCDGTYRLVHQGDGNLVLYKTTTGQALWASNTAGQSSYAFYVQNDGNLTFKTATNRTLWSSGTQGHSGATLSVQNDGNMVLYHNGAIWATNTRQ